MLCPACQYDNPQHVYYCQKCGELLPTQMWEPVTRIDPIPAPMPVSVPPAPPPASTPSANTTPTYSTSTYTASSASDADIVIRMGLVIFVVIFLIYCVTRPRHSSNVDPYSPFFGEAIIRQQTGSGPIRLFVGGREILPNNPEYASIMRMEEASDRQAAKRVRSVLPQSEYPVQSTKASLLHISGYDLVSVSLSRDGKVLVGTNQDDKIALWDAQSGQIRRIFDPPPYYPHEQEDILQHHKKVKAPIPALVSNFRIGAISPDGATLLCSGLGSLGQWDMRTGKFKGYLTKLSPYPIAYSTNGRLLVSGSSGEGGEYGKTFVAVWDFSAHKMTQWQGAPTKEPDIYAASVAWSPDGHFYARGGNAGTVTLWDARTGNVKWVNNENNGSINTLLFTPDSQHLIGSTNSTVTEWDTASGTNYKVLLYQSIKRAACSPNGQWLACLQETGNVTLYHLPTNRLMILETLRKSASVPEMYGVDIKFASDGTKLQCVLPNNVLAVWRFKKRLLP